MASHRFPPPWVLEEQDACLGVRDHDGRQRAYVYYEEEPGRPSSSQAAHKTPSTMKSGPVSRGRKFEITMMRNVCGVF